MELEMDAEHKAYWHTACVWPVDPRMAAHLARMMLAAASVEQHLEHEPASPGRSGMLTARRVLRGDAVTRERLETAAMWGASVGGARHPARAASDAVNALCVAVRDAVMSPERGLRHAEWREMAAAEAVAAVAYLAQPLPRRRRRTNEDYLARLAAAYALMTSDAA